MPKKWAISATRRRMASSGDSQVFQAESQFVPRLRTYHLVVGVLHNEANGACRFFDVQSGGIFPEDFDRARADPVGGKLWLAAAQQRGFAAACGAGDQRKQTLLRFPCKGARSGGARFGSVVRRSVLLAALLQWRLGKENAKLSNVKAALIGAPFPNSSSMRGKHRASASEGSKRVAQAAMEGGEEPEAVHEGVSGSGRSDGEQRESAQRKRVIGAEVVPAEGCPLAVGAPSAAVHGIGGFQRVFHAPPHERGDSAQVIGKAKKSRKIAVRACSHHFARRVVSGGGRVSPRALLWRLGRILPLRRKRHPETMVVLGLRAAVQAFNALLMACPRRTNCGIRHA